MVKARETYRLCRTNGNYQMKLFGMTYSLPIADEFTKLKAICSRCVNDHMKKYGTIPNSNMYPASFTKKVNGDLTKEVEIGAAGMYESCCRYHYNT